MKRELNLLGLALVVLATVAGSAHASSTSATNAFCKQSPSLYFKWAVCQNFKAANSKPTAIGKSSLKSKFGKAKPAHRQRRRQ